MSMVHRLRAISFGRGLGGFLLFLGSIGAAALLLIDWKAQTHTSGLIVMSPAMLVLGIALLCFPGARLSTDDVEQGRLREWWADTPRWHVGVWIAAAVSGTAVSLCGSHFLVGI